MLGPVDVEREDALVHRLKGGQLLVAHLLVGHDEEVDVAEAVGVSDGKRAL